MRPEQIQRIKELTRQDDFVLNEREFLIASCDHTKNGKPMTHQVGPKQAKCKICGKVIDLSRLPDKEDLDKAFAIIDNAIDLIKLGSDDLDDDVRAELGRMSVHQRPIKKLYKKVKISLNDKPRQKFYPGSSDSGYGVGGYMLRQMSGGMGMGMMDDSMAYGGGNKNKNKKKNKNGKKHYNEY